MRERRQERVREHTRLPSRAAPRLLLLLLLLLLGRCTQGWVDPDS
ncbi:hypothetical protein [Streptomyces sp. NBC_00887]|nr:hypothetical protein OG844_12375 [Streptomyces sp. NBC_00887]